MKRIVLSFDGTWNRPAQEGVPEAEQVESNVRRFHESVANTGADGIEQHAWYDEGVGNDWYDHLIGGAIGAGLEANIIEGYKHLSKHYDDGDEVYILGFSRGAYTARSLVGMIRNCGLVKKGHAEFKAALGYGIYRTKSDEPDSWTAKVFRSQFARPINITFVGVWDTVGALGIPLDLFEPANAKFYEFHDTNLSSIVQNAFHAIAIDEHRKPYDVCLWEPKDIIPGQRLEQVWFAGAHSDVGGGYPDRRLSDIALRWMQDRASEVGLALTPVSVSGDNCCGDLTDSFQRFLGGRFAERFPRYYRAIGRSRLGNETLHESVSQRRLAVGGYRPPNCPEH